MDNFLYYIDEKPYLVLVKYKKIKTIRIKIEFDTIEVNCNNLVSNDKIVEVLNRNNDWLKKKIKSNEKIKKNLEFDDLINKKKILLLGKNRLIKYDASISNIIINDDEVILKKANWSYKKLFMSFSSYLEMLYNNKTISIKNRPKLVFKSLKSRWGSYHKGKHEITLNIYLLFFNEEVINYVIDHELSHIKNFNHGKDFYKELLERCPDYKKIQKHMKDYAVIIRKLATI